MKNVLRLVVIVAAIQFASFNHVNAQSNLLLNPGFEDDFNEWANWGGAKNTIVTDGYRSGAKAVKMTSVDADGTNFGYEYRATVVPGGTYTLSAYANILDSAGIGQAHFFLRCFKTDTWDNIGSYDSENFTSVNEFGKVSLTITAPAEPCWFLIAALNTGPAGTTVIFDDFSLVYHENLLTNPGFEDDFNGWANWGGEKNTIVTEGFRSGAKAVKMTSIDADGTNFGYEYRSTVEPGGTYTLSAYANILDSAGIGQAHFFLRCFKADTWDNIGSYDSENFTSVNEFGKVSLTITAPEEPCWFLIAALNTGPAGTTVIFDDFSLYQTAAQQTVKISNKSISLEPGGKFQLSNLGTISDVTWISNNSSSATVDQTGMVTAVTIGVATITVASLDGTVKDSCNVTVANPVTDNLIINPGFEDGIGSWISRGSDSIYIDATESHTGTNSLIMTKPTWASGAVLEGIPCKRITYTYSAWLKGDSSYIFPLLDGLDQYGDPLATHYWGETDYLLTNPDSWTHVSYTFTVDPEPGATDLVLRLIVISKKVMPDTKIWVDDVSLVKLISPVVVDPNNLIVNPGFEAGLAPWEPYSGFNDGSHVSIDSTGGYTGAKLLLITTPAEFASGESGAGVGQNGIPCVEGNYTYSARIMGDSTYLGVILKGLDSDGFEFIRWVGGSDAYAKENPDSWEKVTYTFDIVSDEGDTNLNLRLFIYSVKQGSGSMVMVDDASLIRNYATGITKFNKDFVKLYPNPVVDKLNISLVSANSEVSIYSVSGKLMSKNILQNTTGVIDVSGFAKGVYIVKVNNKYVQKFVK